MEWTPDCTGLLALGDRLMRTPADWPGKPFGSICKRGWIKGLGGGRWSDGWRDPRVDAVQEATRGLAAALMSAEPAGLVRIPERLSIKPAGSPAFPAHLDQNRLGDYQMVIARTSASA